MVFALSSPSGRSTWHAQNVQPSLDVDTCWLITPYASSGLSCFQLVCCRAWNYDASASSVTYTERWY